MTAQVASLSGLLLRTGFRQHTAGSSAFKAFPQSVSRVTSTPRHCKSFAAKAIGAGDPVPDIVLFEGTPDNKVNLKELYGNGTGVLIGLPGAYTPECSSNHLPGFIGKFDELKKAGADVIVCTAVNDPFVLAAWGEVQGADGKVRMLADTHSELTHALDIEMDTSALLGNKRMKRFSAVIEGGKIKTLNIEPDGGGGKTSVSSSQNTLDQLQGK